MVKYDEKFFLHLYNTTKTKPDVCLCGSDLIAQEILKTIAKHNIVLHVIADNEISASSIWLMTNEDLAKLPAGGRN